MRIDAHLFGKLIIFNFSSVGLRQRWNALASYAQVSFMQTTVKHFSISRIYHLIYFEIIYAMKILLQFYTQNALKCVVFSL